jgi:enoyl-CoA hydratase
MSTDEVRFEQRGPAGIVTLARPKALNALTLGMVRAITLQLHAWAADDHVHHVVIRGEGERAFCAGGDVRSLYESGLAKTGYASDFWYEEYQLNTLIKEYPKPFVALIQGIVMGGGVGVSFHGSHRVVCETTVFAMPETGIGLFPDVGGTFFLPRLSGQTGLYLALTGARLKGADLRWLKLATHTARFAEFDTIVRRLTEPGATVARALAPFGEEAPEGTAPLEGLKAEIDRCFGTESVEQTLALLDAADGEFARDASRIIRTKSPTSLKIAFRQMQEGRLKEFRDCMRLEFRITERIQQGHDFYEGVRAAIIEKDGAPRWSPSALEDVKPWMIEPYFAPLEREWDAANPRIG